MVHFIIIFNLLYIQSRNHASKMYIYILQKNRVDRIWHELHDMLLFFYKSKSTAHLKFYIETTKELGYCGVLKKWSLLH